MSKNKDEFPFFLPKSWVNPFGKIPIWPLCKINIFRSMRAYTKAHFVQKQTEMKFPFFDRNHWLTSLNISICPLCQINIF